MSESRLGWSAGWFRAQNSNDILFVASTQTGFGYFKNFGQTRRQGFEADLHGQIRRLSLGGGYTFLDATYQSTETLDGAGNSSNSLAAAGSKGFEGGDIKVAPGDRLPLTPRHMLKAYADLRATKKLTVNLGLSAISSSIARGNENNLHQPDGVYYLGPGRVARLWCGQSRRPLSGASACPVVRPGQQSAGPSLLHRGPARIHRVHGARNFHRQAAAGRRRSVSGSECDILFARCSYRCLGRHTRQFLREAVTSRARSSRAGSMGAAWGGPSAYSP